MVNCTGDASANLRIGGGAAASQIANNVIGVLETAGASLAGTRFSNNEFLGNTACAHSGGIAFANCEFLLDHTPGGVDQYTGCIFWYEFCDNWMLFP